jgi:hypothetical protein|tara:strand:+ start:30001 stop:31746 length:1746 start_codon:yes stop_codon:yes gene_type:complete
MDQQELIQEYARCLQNTNYAIESYLETYDNTQSKYVPFNLFPEQKMMLSNFEEHNDNITKKYRQAGVSTATAAWVSKRLQFASKNRPEKILVIANKLDTASEFANKVRGFLNQWPEWINVGFSKEKDSQKHFKLNNGCEVKAVATSVDALRGYTPTTLIFDEAAYIEAGDDFWAACMASLSTGGKVIVISTPNGYDKIYYEIYEQSIKGLNSFVISELHWENDPRFTKDIFWVKTKDIVHFLLNREDYNEDEFIHESELDKFVDLKHRGYKPCSSWFESMVKKLKYDRRRVAQELESAFLGSGDNVISSEMVEKIKNEDVRDPEEMFIGNQMWVWEKPIKGHRYILGCDVSRGDSEDFTSIVIIDFDERIQVAEYLGKIPPDLAADIIYKWGGMYNAYVVTDITGGMGVATSRKLQELGYKDLYVEGVNTADKWKYNPNAANKIPGLAFNNKRVQIISAFEEALRHKFVVRSKRLLNEMSTFVYINGRPDHMKGKHDDLIMALSMALYVGEHSFSDLSKADDLTKAMLDSWTTDGRSSDTGTPKHRDPQQNPNPFGIPGNQNNDSKQMYKDYAWLFGKVRQ